MENKVIQDRLALLRKKMQEEGIDFYMMPTADFHNSEYVNDYFKVCKSLLIFLLIMTIFG